MDKSSLLALINDKSFSLWTDGHTLTMEKLEFNKLSVKLMNPMNNLVETIQVYKPNLQLCNNIICL